MIHRLVCLPVLLGLLLSACQNNGREALPREELFNLAIGKMEDELDLFQLGSTPFSQKTSLCFRDGTFFIGNGGSSKVLELSSYGDLLSLYYNPSENPKPVMLKEAADSGVRSRRAHSFSLSQVGEIAVSRDKMLYVEDRVPDERAVYDEKLGTLLNKIVLRFDSGGEFRSYLGQEGIGGNPFPFIQSVRVTDNNEVMVQSRIPAGWVVYWFSEPGELLFRANVPFDRLPIPPGGKYLPSLESIAPDPSLRRIYLKMNYYQEGVDSATGIKFGIEKVFSRVYWLNLETGSYEGSVAVPENVQRKPKGGMFETQETEYLYEMLGVTAGGNIFLLSREENNLQQLLILSTSGAVVKRRYLKIEDDQLIYSVFFLSSEGILTALLADERRARVVWWRSDKLIGKGS
jgi:hypothetical protein